MAPGGLSWITDDRSMPVSAGIATNGWIEPASAWKEGRLGLAETACTVAPSAWQHVELLAAEETGQFAPQQGHAITAAACAAPQPKPACSPTTSASKAINPFFTKLKLTPCAARCNALSKHARPPSGARRSCSCLQDAAMKVAYALGRRSKRQQKQLRFGRDIFTFSGSTLNS